MQKQIVNRRIRVLLCGYHHYSYLDFIAKGFEEAGADVRVFAHQNISVKKLQQGNFLRRWKNNLKIEKINKGILQSCQDFEPDFLLAINGEPLLAPTVASLNQHTPTALWLVDSVESLNPSRETLQQFQKKFVFEPADKKQIPTAHFLAYACAPDVYKPLPGKQQVYDVGFVGAGHHNRFDFLEGVARFCISKSLKFGVWGPYDVFLKKSKKDYIAQYPNLFKSIVVNDRLTPEVICSIYNTVKVNLNVHHPQSRDGVNVRTFEIAGSQAFQLVDNKKEIYSLFGHDEIKVYDSFDDLLSLIAYFVENELSRKLIAAKAYRKVLQQHTFSSRCQEILGFMLD